MDSERNHVNVWASRFHDNSGAIGDPGHSHDRRNVPRDSGGSKNEPVPQHRDSIHEETISLRPLEPIDHTISILRA
jgi:hypothetical protein